MLSAGPTPRTALTPGPFALEAEDGTPLASWNWDEFRALGSTETGRVGRIDLRAVTALLEGLGGVADSFVCGPDGFVEVASAH